MNKRKFGIIGEKIAQGYLINKGYEILETNFYTSSGELDIIAKLENCIVFVEVKTRTNLQYGLPSVSVNKTKKQHMIKTANVFIHQNKLYKCELRFDVIEIIIKNGKCKINHIEGAIQ